MYPVLFSIGEIPIDSYNVLWLVALSLAILWCVRRRFGMYGIDDGEGRRVVCWAFLFMLLGAGLYKPLLRVGSLSSNPLEALSKGGLSEIGAMVGAFLAGVLLCWNNPKVPFQRLCDAATPCAILSIVIGRWGCFLNGCCVGIISDFPLAVHFPKDAPGVFRHPAVVAPLTMILYSIMRLTIDELRAPTEQILEFPLGRYMLIAGLPLECIWLTHSIRKITGQATF
jgi:phosphatidylglycerol:prolipoprotein diacylglycerol transferase